METAGLREETIRETRQRTMSFARDVFTLVLWNYEVDDSQGSHSNKDNVSAQSTCLNFESNNVILVVDQ